MPDVSDPVCLTTNADGVAELVLGRPAAGNALTLVSCQALSDMAEALRQPSGIRAVLLRAEGRAFCVGGDLTAFAAASAPAGCGTT